MEKLEPSTSLAGMQNGVAAVRNSMEIPQEIKDRTTIGSSHLTSGYLSKKLKSGSQRDICTTMIIATLFIIAGMWTES